MFAVERAHRVPFRQPAPGAPPRAFLLKLLNYRDRDAILGMARQKQSLEFLNTKISIYSDFSAEVQRRQAKYSDVKKRLRELEITYSTIYPSKLRVVDGNSTKFFDTPQDAAFCWISSIRNVECNKVSLAVEHLYDGGRELSGIENADVCRCLQGFADLLRTTDSSLIE